MKSIYHFAVIILFTMVSLVACSSDLDSDEQSTVERCWTIKSNTTQLPIEGASLNIIYDYHGSKLGPFVKYPVADENGVACASFPSNYFIIQASAWAPEFRAQGFNTGNIPDIIYLEPLD